MQMLNRALMKSHTNGQYFFQESTVEIKQKSTSTIHFKQGIRQKRTREIRSPIVKIFTPVFLIVAIHLSDTVLKVQGFTMSRILKLNLVTYRRGIPTMPPLVFPSGLPSFQRKTPTNKKQNSSFSTSVMKLSTRNLTSKVVTDTTEIQTSFIPPPPENLSKTSPTQDQKHSSIISKPTSNNNDSIEKPLDLLFSLQVPEGRCVGLYLNIPEKQAINPDKNFWLSILQSSSSTHTLHPKEMEFGTSLPGKGETARSAQTSFFLGRLAIRAALEELIRENNKKNDYDVTQNNLVLDQDKSILKDEHGRPTMPTGFLGSISHKHNTGVALVDVDCTHEENIQGKPRKQRRGIGVDIEQSITKRISVAKRVLTKNEIKELGKIKGVTEEEEVLLRFSLKESVYKAMHPLLCQFVGFQEAEITPNADGTASVSLNLKNGAHELFSEKHTTAHWRRIEGDYFLTSASIMLKEDVESLSSP